MAKIPGKILTWQMIQPASRNIETGKVIPGKLEKKEPRHLSQVLVKSIPPNSSSTLTRVQF